MSYQPVKMVIIVRTFFAFVVLSVAQLYSLSVFAKDTTQINRQINAVYRIEFNGFKLGKVRFSSKFWDKSYLMSGRGKLSAIKGLLFKAKMQAESSGAVKQDGFIKPGAFSYLYKQGKKTKKLKMKFTKDPSQRVVAVPPFNKSKKRVPITAKQLDRVFDPMSALSVLSAPKGAFPNRKICDQRIPVFDGKERFDIILSYKKTIKVKGVHEKDYNGRAYVCRAQYVQISGHKSSDKNKKFLAGTKDIEIWLAPLLAAKLYVPYFIKVPTRFGPATIRARGFRVTEPGLKSVSLIQ